MHNTVFDNLEEGFHTLYLRSLSFVHKMSEKKLGPFYIAIPLFTASGEASLSGNDVTLHLEASLPAHFYCQVDNGEWVPCE